MNPHQLIIKCLLSTYKQPSFTKHSSPYSVSAILENNKKNPLFVYRQTKQICNTIKSLFDKIPQKPQYNISQLKRLFNNIHLSTFSSWKILKQTSNFINSVLNQNLNHPNLMGQKQLLSLCQVLHNLNYDLDQNQDKNFLQSQLQSHIKKPNHFDFTQQNDLKTLQVFSKHSSIFSSFQQQKKKLQQHLLKIVNDQTKGSKYSYQLLTSIIKNGIYQSFWQQNFLKNLKVAIQSSEKKKETFKSLLNALKLNDKNYSSSSEWTVKETTQNDSSSNIVTQQKIFNILKQMDYNVQTNQCIHDYEVDYKVGQNFIVQYHGVHHYKTNTNKPVETMKSSWKVQCLRNKGYKVFVVPFYDWNQIETIYDKKKWLIKNMEKSLFLS